MFLAIGPELTLVLNWTRAELPAWVYSLLRMRIR
jgi:hypothetical protein